MRVGGRHPPPCFNDETGTEKKKKKYHSRTFSDPSVNGSY
jgi:hypothetical protein